MGHHLEMSNWPRRQTFDFFLDYDQPFFNICAGVDVRPTLEACRAQGRSFFLASWYACMKAVNSIEPFRYRLRDKQVWVHDKIHVGATVLTRDEVFRFCYFEWAETFAAFEEDGIPALEKIKQTPAGGPLVSRDQRDDLVHGSVIPWLSFTSLAHAKRFDAGLSTPRIAFGKYTTQGEEVHMPVSVEVHHALMDAIHVARFFEAFQNELSTPTWLNP